MCGIAGVIGFQSELSDRDRAEARRMAAMLRHRGPDSEGFFSDSRVFLGNTRLKIIDLSSDADLPMSSPNKSLHLAYNGEVTNFQELKIEFGLSDKQPFRSHSDTEVVLRLYERLGLDFLRHLSGMFAFLLYDAGRRKAYLVRDFFGLRPVFYMVRHGKLYFGSEIKAFMDLEAFRDDLDLEGIYHYFSLAYLPGRHTPFRDVHELGGGRLLEVDLTKGTVEEKEYHSLRYAADPSLTEDVAVPRLKTLMREAVRRNFIADVPVGLTFSGGFDTSSLLVLAKELGHRPHTFSIKIGEASFDESRYQRVMVDFVKPIHHEITVGPEDVLGCLERHMAFLDEPSGDGGNIPFFLLAEEAKKHVKVLLSGEGGDEIFNAYETHRALRARAWYRRFAPSSLRRLIRTVVSRFPASYRKLSLDFVFKRFTEGAELNVPESHIYYRHPFAEDDVRRLFVTPPGHTTTGALFTEMYDRLDFEDELDRISWLDIYTYFIDDLMVKNDRMVMAHSIEARYPFMDAPLVEFMSRVSPDLRVRGLGGRYLQKRAMEGLLPPDIHRRKNMGLEMPHSIWFLDEFRPLAEKYFSRKHLDRCGLFDPAVVQSLWREHLSRRRDNGRGLWSLLMFLVWFDLFVYERRFKDFLSKETVPVRSNPELATQRSS
jgi:asparagine synthase (glutamine-hydrolysing)